MTVITKRLRPRAALARAGALAGVVFGLVRPPGAGAQGATLVAGGRLGDWSDAVVGSEEENYLRLLQVAGVAPARPWSVRPFGVGALRGAVSDTARHPWRARMHFGDARASAGLRWTGAAAGTVFNSAFPYGYADGAVWAGRGLTGYARGGLVARWRWFSARAEPVVFWTANRDPGLVPNGQTDARRFGDALEPLYVDLPQRFGAGGYGRLDLGQSTVRADAGGFTAGVTTANQVWGPALVDPLVMSANAAGYPRVFVGTARPVNIGVGTVHGIVQSGRLRQSAYGPMPADSASTYGTGVAVVLTVRGVRGLEVGGSRFFHEAWDGSGRLLDRIAASAQGFYGYSGGTARTQNQLGSLFARWVFAPARAEVYGEFFRNDASVDTRDFLLEPDHNSGWLVGARRAWVRPDGTLAAVRVEASNTRVTQLESVRGQSRPYQHWQLRAGHTMLGQALGSEAGQGGGATIVGYDRYQTNGRWTFELARRLVQSTLLATSPADAWDVRYVARAERLRFGRRADLFVGVAPIAELNRAASARDVYAVRLDAGWRFGSVGAAREAVPTR